MNEFQERFKNFDNRKLLQIIEGTENYQSIAVEAARLELSKRDISNEEIQDVKDESLEKKIKIVKRKEQFKKVENKVKSIGTELFETVNPIQKKSQTISRKINLIVIVFGLLATYHIFKEFGMLQFMFTDSLAQWGFSMVLYFLPMIILPIAVFFFWKRNKIGWILMASYFVYNIVNAIGMFFLTWEWNKKDDYSSGELQIVFHEIESLYLQSNPIIYLVIVAIFGATLWVTCKEDLRTEFEIDFKSGLITIGIAALITISIMGVI